MILPDVSVLVYAHRRDAQDHERYRDWLSEVVNADRAFGLSDMVLSGFLRVATHPRIFVTPTPLADALEFAARLRAAPNRVAVTPGPRHWPILERICTGAKVKGSLVADAYLAALAIESGSELITTDRDFARFSELRWRPPFPIG